MYFPVELVVRKVTLGSALLDLVSVFAAIFVRRNYIGRLQGRIPDSEWHWLDKPLLRRGYYVDILSKDLHNFRTEWMIQKGNLHHSGCGKPSKRRTF